MQRRRPALGTWLQDFSQIVDVKEMRNWLQRMKEWEPHRYSAAVAAIEQRTSLPQLFSLQLPLNPVLLYLLHHLTSSMRPCHHTLETPVQASPELLSSRSGDDARASCPAGGDHKKVAVGEVWWLFDVRQPYLAEVFKDGNIPCTRLPYLDRSSVRGMHVARLLGKTTSKVKILPKSARFCLYTPW